MAAQEEYSNDELRAVDELRAAIEANPMVDKEGRTIPYFPRRDARFMMAFLRSRKFDIGRTLTLYQNYSKFLWGHRDKLHDLSLERDVEPLYRMGFMRVYRNARTRGGGRIMLLFPGRLDAHAFEGNLFEQMLRFNLYTLTRMFEDAALQQHGMVILEEFTGFSLWNAMSFNTLMTKQEQEDLFRIVQDQVPLRMSGILLINQPWYVSFLLAVAKPFMKKKMRDRIQMLGNDREALLRHVDEANLPTELGGRFEEDTDAFLQELRDTEDLLRSEGIAVQLVQGEEAAGTSPGGAAAPVAGPAAAAGASA